MSESSNFVPKHARHCRGPISRRSFLEAGALSLLGKGMSDVLRAETIAKAAGRKVREKSVIFIWLPGGMSHLESYDMKPDAPLEYRSTLRPIKTNVAGLDICELFPRQAKIADKFNIIRSVCHEFADHTPSLPEADPRSDRPRCDGRESKFLAAGQLGKQVGDALEPDEPSDLSALLAETSDDWESTKSYLHMNPSIPPSAGPPPLITEKIARPRKA